MLQKVDQLDSREHLKHPSKTDVRMPKSNYTHRNNIFAFAMSLHASWYILVSFPSF